MIQWEKNKTCFHGHSNHMENRFDGNCVKLLFSYSISEWMLYVDITNERTRLKLLRDIGLFVEIETGER